MYEYLDRKPEAGDIVECQTKDITSFSKNKLYICKKLEDTMLFTELDDKGSTTNGVHPKHFKVVKTLPGDCAKVGDTCIRTGSSVNNQYNGSKMGDVFNVTHISADWIGYKPDYSTDSDKVRVLCIAETKPKAYYKRSGKPWTVEEIAQIPNHWNPKYANYNLQNKWAYPSIVGQNEYFSWSEQTPEEYPECYNLVAFEDEFPDIETLPIPKPALEDYRPGAQSEPTQSIIKEPTMTFQQLIHSIFQEEIQTDYDKKPNYLVVIYNNEGTEIAQATANSVKQVEDKIQSTPKLWGAKAIIYSIDSEVQTAVPITTTKLKKI